MRSWRLKEESEIGASPICFHRPPKMKTDYSCDISILRLLVAKNDRSKKEKKENISAVDKTE